MTVVATVTPETAPLSAGLSPDDPCFLGNLGRRRLFWTTIQDACGTYELCGNECSIPGLQYVDSAEGRSIRADERERVRSLILNILNTRARSTQRCISPAGVYGHWSESYRDDGLYVGSRMWDAAAKPYIRTNDAVKSIQAAIQADMGKLIATGAADSVHVEATYMGRNAVAVVITATKANVAPHVLNLSGSFVSGSTWVWR